MDVSIDLKDVPMSSFKRRSIPGGDTKMELSLSVNNIKYEITNVEKKFFFPVSESNMVLLDDINFRIPAGDLCAIMGPSGNSDLKYF